MVAKLLSAIAKRIRQIGVNLADKANDNVDEYVLEHFLLYHGLVGSSPDNRNYKDVRADIRIAVQHSSPVKMAIALQLPPLWWEDKLETIFSEIVHEEGTERILAALHPADADETWPNRFDPLGHPDWHVRSNAALMLGSIGAKVAAPRMSRALRDSASGAKAAFAHVAYGLGKLGSDQGRPALEEFLYSDEPWFRVDAAGALSHWPVAVVGDTLMKAMLSSHSLSDYMAVTIAKRQKPAAYLESTHPSARAGACAMIIGLIDASAQTFSEDIIAETGVLECSQRLVEIAKNSPTPLAVRAALRLLQWQSDNAARPGSPETVAFTEFRDAVSDEKTASMIADHVHNADAKMNSAPAELRNAVILAGDLKAQSAVAGLLSMLKVEQPFLNETIEALGKIGDVSAVQPLLFLSNQLVSMKQRTSLPLSKQPTADDNPPNTKAYWNVLKALGRIPSAVSLPYLLEAVADFAPDKRDQALISALNVYAQAPDVEEFEAPIKEAVTNSLHDPAAQVRVTALGGVAQLGLGTLVGEVIKLTESAEISVGRKAFAVLSDLWDVGYEQQVKSAVQSAMQGQANKFRRESFAKLLQKKSRQL